MTTASRYEKGVDFCIAALEDGKEYDDLPIFAAREGVLQWQSPSEPPKMREIPGAEDTAFVIENVLSKPECEQIIALTEAMGYHQDAPVNLGRDIRQNENCVWVTEDEITDTIFQRCAHLLPQRFELPRRDGTGMQIGPIAGLNARWRLYKYSPGDIFRRHHDGSWTPSAIIDGPDGVQVEHDVESATRLSFMTFLMYLNDGFEGGETTFYLQAPVGGLHPVPVEPVQGSVLCFWHGQHPRSPMHEGSAVRRGTKYVARSDVLYEVLGGWQMALMR